MGVRDARAHLGLESTYGTPVTPTRSYEVQEDIASREVDYLESRGMRKGAHTLRSDRRTVVNMGAAGPFSLDIQNKGFGLLGKLMFGSAAIAQQGATAAYLQTFLTTVDGSSESATTQIFRPYPTTSGQTFTYHGGVCTEWQISAEVGGLLTTQLTMDYEDESTSESEATEAYPASTSTFGWPLISITVDGSAVEASNFTVTGDLGMKTDRRFLRGSALKRKPVRVSEPDYSGELAAEFDSTTAYTRFTAGTIVPIVITATGAVIEGAHNYQVIITMAACQFTGATPQSSLDDIGSQPMPFKCLWDGSSPAVKLEYKSTDTAA